MRLIILVVFLLLMGVFLGYQPDVWDATTHADASTGFCFADDDDKGGKDDDDDDNGPDDDDDGEDDDDGKDDDDDGEDDDGKSGSNLGQIGGNLTFGSPFGFGGGSGGGGIATGPGFGNQQPRGRTGKKKARERIEKKIIEVSRLPEEVTVVLDREYPSATKKEAAQYAKKGKPPVFFSVVVQIDDNKQVKVTVSPKGKILRRQKQAT